MKNNNYSYIICIDDNEEFLKSLETLLPPRINNQYKTESHLYRFEFFSDPVEALNSIKQIKDEEEISMIITDQKMPKIKGIQLLEQVKPIFPEAIRVLLTGHAGLESAITAINNNLLDKYLVKPISDISDFTVVINNLLEKYLISKKLTLQNSLIDSKLAFVTSLSQKKTIESTSRYIIGFTKKLLKVDQISIFLKDNHKYRLQSGSNISEDCIGKVHLKLTKTAIEKLFGKNSCTPVDNFLKHIEAEIDISYLYENFKEKNALLTKLIANNKLIGVMYVTKKPDYPFSESDKSVLSYLSRSASIALANQRNIFRLEQTYIDVIKSLITALEESDPYTKGHSVRVSRYAKKIAIEMGLSQKFIRSIDSAGILHDIGKIGIPISVLNKPGKLTDEEFDLIKSHSEKGESIIWQVKFLKNITPIIRSHHERFDGNGYPDGLAGEDIPLGARILAVADTFDAMTSSRPYRHSLSYDKAIAEIKRVSGTQLDKECASAFLQIISNMDLSDN